MNKSVKLVLLACVAVVVLAWGCSKPAPVVEPVAVVAPVAAVTPVVVAPAAVAIVVPPVKLVVKQPTANDLERAAYAKAYRNAATANLLLGRDEYKTSA